MKSVDIQNFRKLKQCRIEFAENETLFVGSNNSGKTSAMDALISFLQKDTNFCTTDFTLSNWININKIGETWDARTDLPPFALSLWQPYVPSLDVWLNVDKTSEIHHIIHLIPTLDWTGGCLGVRLILEPKDVEGLYKGYTEARKAATNTFPPQEGSDNEHRLSLWPTNMKDFLDKKLHSYFSLNAYILDPSKYGDKEPQSLPLESEPIAKEPFKGLVKIDIINAQRGFYDQTSEGQTHPVDKKLSAQLRDYFEKHLDPTEFPGENDMEALEALDAARVGFDKNLQKHFKAPLDELKNLNYPGFENPQITLSCQIKPQDGLNHDTAVQFKVVCSNEKSEKFIPCLPEHYNGLGYRNLISMVFKLIGFRDKWMRVGKAGKKMENHDNPIEPLHIVIIEEPEAHLHPQAQRVFIKKAYGILREHSLLKDKDQFHTQLIVSTHSSHIVHEVDFACLRYFKREPMTKEIIPCVQVVNLQETFGSSPESSKFATRYLKATHCDLFFADAAILVEGSAERMLIPYFIQEKYKKLASAYVSLLEIGGSHAHRLRPLIEILGIITLIITDVDSKGTDSTAGTKKKMLPKKGQRMETGNTSIRDWVPNCIDLDEVLEKKYDKKTTEDGNIRIAYQYGIDISHTGVGVTEEAFPYTFEDALVLTNLEWFKAQTDTTGLMNKMVKASSLQPLSDAQDAMFKALDKGNKAEMALELLYRYPIAENDATKIAKDSNRFAPPKYIDEGLKWLEDKLTSMAEKQQTN